MKKTIRFTAKATLGLIISLIATIITYLGISICFSIIPVNTGFREDTRDSIQIFLRSNGIHTDLVVPLKNNYKDWTDDIDTSLVPANCRRAHYIAFGWGDSDLYIHTKTIKDLRWMTAVRAAFYPRASVLHAEFYSWMGEDDGCVGIYIDSAQYRMLSDFILSTISVDSIGRYRVIQGVSHGDYDIFYRARGSYHLFNTSNTWINDCLKAGRMKACLWTPIAQPFYYHYKSKKRRVE